VGACARLLLNSNIIGAAGAHPHGVNFTLGKVQETVNFMNFTSLNPQTERA